MNESITGRHTLTLPSTLDTVDRMEQEAESFATAHGFNDDDAANIAMAVREATVNAVLHGNSYSRDKQVNAAVTPVTDMDHWGVVDRWDYPADGKGDCEDYALLKRNILMQEGYPRQALLITVVKDHEGEGHAILTVKTSRGDFVLDNLNDRVMAWGDTGYKFIKRQSQTDPNVWQSIGTPVEGPQFTAR